MPDVSVSARPAGCCPGSRTPGGQHHLRHPAIGPRADSTPCAAPPARCRARSRRRPARTSGRRRAPEDADEDRRELHVRRRPRPEQVPRAAVPVGVGTRSLPPGSTATILLAVDLCVGSHAVTLPRRARRYRGTSGSETRRKPDPHPPGHVRAGGQLVRRRVVDARPASARARAPPSPPTPAPPRREQRGRASSTARRPRPTSSSAPTRLRTIEWQNASACTAAVTTPSGAAAPVQALQRPHASSRPRGACRTRRSRARRAGRRTRR